MAILQLTDLQIVTEALKRLGVTSGYPTAVDGSDTSKYGSLVYPTYQLTRDEEVRQAKWGSLIKRAQLSPAYYADSGASWTSGSTTMVVTDSSAIVVGWVVGTALILGNPPATAPAGIPAGTTVASITDSTHVVMSNAATADGSGTVYFQVDSESGYWYAYRTPADSLFVLSVYAVAPASQYFWPFNIQEILQYDWLQEGGYVFTNIDNSNGNPIAAYLVEPSDGTPPFASDFTEALILRLAGKIAMAVGHDMNIKRDVNSEYLGVQSRAKGRANMERANHHRGEQWWRR